MPWQQTLHPVSNSYTIDVDWVTCLPDGTPFYDAHIMRAAICGALRQWVTVPLEADKEQ